MPLDPRLVEDIALRLRQAQRILVVSHIRPDGDAVGSVLGWSLSLRAAGKQVTSGLADGVPGSFRHVPGSDRVRRRPEGPFDLVCVVDCSDPLRVGEVYPGAAAPDINIDHHVTNLNYGRINLVVPQAVATAEILADLIQALDLPLTQDAASALLTGLLADTLGFRTSNMTPKALRLGADLMERGAHLPELYRQALHRHSFEALRYWGCGLGQLQRQGKVAWTCLTLEHRQAVGYPGRDDADLINLLSTVEGIDIVIMFVEQGSQRVKVSWRSQPGIDVSKIALAFGGGGHPAAAGAEISGGLAEVQQRVLAATFALDEQAHPARDGEDYISIPSGSEPDL